MKWPGRQIVPILAHPVERDVRALDPEAPEDLSLCWGKPARADLSREAREDPASEGGFNTIRQPEYKRVKKVHDLTPVYAEFDVYELPHADRPDDKMEVAVTRAIIFRLGEVTEKRIVAVTFAAGVVVHEQWQNVKIARYLRLAFALPNPKRSTFLYSDTWGDYPPEPEEP